MSNVPELTTCPITSPITKKPSHDNRYFPSLLNEEVLERENIETK